MISTSGITALMNAFGHRGGAGQADRGPDDSQLTKVAQVRAADDRLLRRVPGLVRVWLATRANRRHLEATLNRLAETSPHLLDDIGMDYEAALTGAPARLRTTFPATRPVLLAAGQDNPASPADRVAAE